MNKSLSVLGVGPMSKDIIKSVYSYSHIYKVPLMLIASKNQVDYKSGYVSNTKNFSLLCKEYKKKYSHSRVFICRDHCGPGFNGSYNLEDVYTTIDIDIENDFDLIHIDYCHLKASRETMLKESRQAIEYILNKKPTMMIEIGTDINTGKNFQDIKRVEGEMAYFASFFSPTFFVCQTGTIIKELGQFGSFDKEYVKKLSLLAKKYHLNIKEHNADYLSSEEIRLRKNLISAMNIAPQLGVLQTLISLEKAKTYGIRVDEFLEASYKSRKWEKWLDTSKPTNKLLCSLISGHYCFNSKEYQKIYAQLERREDFSKTIETEVHKLIQLYIEGLNANEEV